MSAHFLRVDLNRANAQFRPVTITPGMPLLDRPGGLTHYTIARKWLGELIAEPRWGSRGIAYFIRAKDNQRLIDVRCVPLSERDARRKVIQMEMEKLRASLAKVKPEPDETSLLTALRQAFEEVRAGAQRNRQGDSLFKYRDAEGKLRLVWAWGYARKDLCPGTPQICPKCSGLFVRPAEGPLICALCGWRPATRRWARKAFAALALVAIALGLGSWWPNRTPAGPLATPSIAKSGEQLALVAGAATGQDQPPSVTQPEALPANKLAVALLPTGAKNAPTPASGEFDQAHNDGGLKPTSATKSGTGGAAGNTHDPLIAKPNSSPTTLVGGADKSAADGAAKAATASGSPSHGPGASTPVASAGHAPAAVGSSGHGLGSGSMGGSGHGLGSGSMGGSGTGGAGLSGSIAGAAHPATAGTVAGHSGLGAVATVAAASRPPLKAAGANYDRPYTGVVGPFHWGGIGSQHSVPYRGGILPSVGIHNGRLQVDRAAVRAGMEGRGPWANVWEPGDHYVGWTDDRVVTNGPAAIVGGPGAVVTHTSVSGVKTATPHTVLSVPPTSVVDSLNVAPSVEVSVAAAPTMTGSAGSWFQSVQALNAAQTDAGVQLELEVQGENQVGGLEYRLVEPGDATDLDWYPARQNGPQTRVVLLSPKLAGPPADGTYQLMIEARNTATHERAQFPYAFRLVLGVHPETTGNSKH